MTPRKFIGLIVILTVSTLFGCGRGGGGNSGGSTPAQPVRANVFIAFDQSVTNLAGLDLMLNNSAGATFDNNAQQIAAINAAQGSLTLTVGNFDAATNTNHVVLVNGNAAGIITGTDPIIRLTYDVAEGSGSPTFSVSTEATFTAIAPPPGSGPTTPPVSAANVVVTVTYE